MDETEKIENTDVKTETKDVTPVVESKSEESPAVEVDSSGKPVEDKAGFVRNLMNKIGIGKKEEIVENTEKEGIDIPDDFTNIAKALGWEDKDIVEFASDYSDEELKEMIPFLTDTDDKLEPDKPATHEETPKPQPTPVPKEGIEALKEEIRKEFQAEIASLKEKVSVVDKARETHDSQVLMDNINKTFDEAGKTFAVFGQTKDLPVFPAGPKKGQYVPNSPQMKARVEVCNKAAAFAQAGASVDEAMQDALTWYKGKYLEADVKRNLVKDLKEHETRLSAKRSSKETTPVYEDEEERQVTFIKKEAERLGLKLNED